MRSEWELVHGFYALMGGFALTSDRTEGTFFPRDLTRATLTPNGLEFLLQHEPQALPNVTADQIRDKSKADGLKKTLVCAQALWFCIQCITRLSQSLPISLLELNTVGHALCALVIYLLWWDKPLDICEPTLISDPKYHPILAYMWMSSRISAKGAVGYDVGGRLRDEFDCLWPFENPVVGDLIFTPRTPGASDPANFPASLGVMAMTTGLFGPPPVFRVVPSMIARKGLPPAPGRLDWSFRRYVGPRYTVLQTLVRWNCLPKRALNYSTGLSTRPNAIHSVLPTDVARWELAHTAIQKYGLELDLRERHATGVDGRGLRSRVAVRQQNVIFVMSSVQFTVALTVSGILYGGLHLVAWNAIFPSRNEQILWRTSALCVACNGLLLGLAAQVSTSPVVRRALYQISSLRHPRKTRPMFMEGDHPHMFDWALHSVWVLLFGISIIALPLLWFSYVAARVFLVVESFKDLSYLPSGAFDTPTWSAYFPHIT
ncbi:MAG: hypothetical protein Q9218_007819 [Villophora microphyllina]